MTPGQQRAAALIRNARAESGLSLRDLATEIGWSKGMRQRLSDWEHGRRMVSVKNLEKILNACGRELVLASKERDDGKTE